jgi:hypothetical protein
MRRDAAAITRASVDAAVDAALDDGKLMEFGFANMLETLDLKLSHGQILGMKLAFFAGAAYLLSIPDVRHARIEKEIDSFLCDLEEIRRGAES